MYYYMLLIISCFGVIDFTLSNYVYWLTCGSRRAAGWLCCFAVRVCSDCALWPILPKAMMGWGMWVYV
jgi:hypothetical protein